MHQNYFVSSNKSLQTRHKAAIEILALKYPFQYIKGLEMQMVMSQHFITLKLMVMIYFYYDIMDLLKAAETHKVCIKEENVPDLFGKKIRYYWLVLKNSYNKSSSYYLIQF